MKSVLITYQENLFLDILNNVKSILQEYKVVYSEKEREDLVKEDYSGKNLVIVIGGDGTFLRANHLNKDVPMFGINPIPEKKEGFLMQSTKDDYEEKLVKVINDDYKIKKILRLEVTINDKKVDEYVLNEVYIGDAKPYNMYNYDIILDGKEEFQRSSGVLIGTSAGSNAWLKSAGGKVLSKFDDKFQFIVREPYECKLTKDYKLKKGVLSEDKTIKFVSKTKGVLVIDSIGPEFKLRIQDKVFIKPSPNYLCYVVV